MSINPLDTFGRSAFPVTASAACKQAAGSAGFATMLDSLQGGDGARPGAQQAAADLLRMEMMQSTLSLFGDEEDGSQNSDVRGLESLLANLAGNRQQPVAGNWQEPVAGPGQAPVGGKAQAPLAAAGDDPLMTELLDSTNGSDSRIGKLEKTAEQYLGIPYRFGGEGPTGIDCSSFVQQVFGKQQIHLPRTAREQINMGSEVPAGELKKGDLLFFHTYASYPSHVGIYLGDGKMIHASSAKGEVTVSDINSNYYRSHFIAAKRVA